MGSLCSSSIDHHRPLLCVRCSPTAARAALRPARCGLPGRHTAPVAGPLRRSAIALASPPSAPPGPGCTVCPRGGISPPASPAAPAPVSPATRPRPAPFAFACNAVWSLRTVSGACRFSPVPMVPFPFLASLSTEAPSLHRHYPASSLLRASPPPCRPKLALAGSRLTRARHRQGFPCCFCFPLSHMPSPFPRRRRPVLKSLASRSLAAFPVFTAGRPPHCLFRGLLDVHSRYGLHVR